MDAVVQCEQRMLGSGDQGFPPFYRMPHEIYRFCWEPGFIQSFNSGSLLFNAAHPRIRGFSEVFPYLSVGSTSSFLGLGKAGRCSGLAFVWPLDIVDAVP